MGFQHASLAFSCMSSTIAHYKSANTTVFDRLRLVLHQRLIHNIVVLEVYDQQARRKS